MESFLFCHLGLCSVAIITVVKSDMLHNCGLEAYLREVRDLYQCFGDENILRPISVINQDYKVTATFQIQIVLLRYNVLHGRPSLPLVKSTIPTRYYSSVQNYIKILTI